MLFILFEHAVGYCLFEVQEYEEIGSFLPQVEDSVQDGMKFKKVVRLIAFRPFVNAASALENINAISEGILSNDLHAFLDVNLPKGKHNIKLGVSDSKLAGAINDAMNISITHVGAVPEIIRGIRIHLPKFVKGLSSKSMMQAELGLGHSYSRGKVKFNVNRVDNMIIQSIALVDQLDKDINTFSMRIRQYEFILLLNENTVLVRLEKDGVKLLLLEWYSYHFPELYKIVSDNYQYAMCTFYIQNRNSLSEESIEKLEEIAMDSSKAQAILSAARMSMGMDISPIDLLNITHFAKKVISLAEYRKSLAEYLRSKMHSVAPNLSALLGEVISARLISKAGSLTSLAKYPASTVQILGAEKALFRALRKRTSTPKYGLLYNSTFIGKATAKNKGRISRYLANKSALASRIDSFSDIPSDIYGLKFRQQVEDRLKFYETGEIPPTNLEVIAAANKEHQEFLHKLLKKKKKEAKKRALEEENSQALSVQENMEEQQEPPHKKKKKKVEMVEEPETLGEKFFSQVNGVNELDENVQADLELSAKKKKKKKKKESFEAVEMSFT